VAKKTGTVVETLVVKEDVPKVTDYEASKKMLFYSFHSPFPIAAIAATDAVGDFIWVQCPAFVTLHDNMVDYNFKALPYVGDTLTLSMAAFFACAEMPKAMQISYKKYCDVNNSNKTK